MNKYEKKLRKIKGLYSLLNKQNEQIAIKQVKEADVWCCRTYTEFCFEFDSEYACFELNVFKHSVKYSDYSGLEYRTPTGLDYYKIMDIFYGTDCKNFKNIKISYLNDYVGQLTKFVRNALKHGMDSMSYRTQTEYVKVANYLDFEEKESLQE